MRYAQELERIISWLKAASSDHSYYVAAVGEKDKEKTDIEHAFELNHLDSKSRSRLGKELQQALRTRRQYKNIVECTEPIAVFLQLHPKLLSELAQLLGTVRKVEKYHDTRQYIPRIRKDLEIGKK